MKKIVKYSKSYKSIFRIKKDFYNNNSANLKKSIKTNKYYTTQKKRKKCKNCYSTKSKYLFKSFGVNYFICKKCSHLNGAHEDSKKFTNFLYRDNKGKNYSKNYISDYKDRVKKIYLPKVEFLKKVIGKNFNIIDIGSGAGHFLKACEISKINAIGHEPNSTLIKLAKRQLKKNFIYKVNLENIYERILYTKEKCISLIGVMEHLENPNKVLDNFKKSKASFLYLSLPLFSLSVLLENVFQDVFPRQLGGGHTHLYTQKSINYFVKKYKLKIIGEWWFGTDLADLFRSLVIKSNYNNNTAKQKIFNELLYKYLDDLQNVLDKGKACSEVHIILAKK